MDEIMACGIDKKNTLMVTSPKCGGKMEEVKHSRMKCAACGFEIRKDVAAVLNVEKRAREVLGNPLFPHSALKEAQPI